MLLRKDICYTENEGHRGKSGLEESSCQGNKKYEDAGRVPRGALGATWAGLSLQVYLAPAAPRSLFTLSLTRILKEIEPHAALNGVGPAK
jgi:hypothetical protein